MKPNKKSLTRKLDKICSEIVRSRGSCERCGNTKTLQCAHVFSRTYRNTRWDLDNLLCLCAGCHFITHKQPIEFAEWLKRKDPNKYDNLRIKHLKIKKWTLEEMQELYKKLCSLI